MRLSFALAVLMGVVDLGIACPGHVPRGNVDEVTEHLRKRQVPLPQTTLIENVRYFDGYKMTSPKTVLLENGFISSVQPPAGATADVVVNGTGKFLIPGLLDSHIHISLAVELEVLASYGVTTAVNMGCPNTKFCESLMNITRAAHMVTASLPAVGAGSVHAIQAGGSDNHTLSPGDNTTLWVEQWGLPTGTPASFLKVVAEPSGPDQATLNGLVAAAHNIGYYVAMHASYLSAYEQAIVSKPEIIQHVPSDGLLNASMAQQIYDQGQYVTPTMAIFRMGANSPYLETFLEQNITFGTVKANAAALHKAGVPMLAGTDAVNLPDGKTNTTLPFGISLHCELEFLVEIGMTPAEALRAATMRAAQIQHLYDRGYIFQGMKADVVLLNTNPLANITNSRDIGRVWTGGVECGPVTRDLTTQCSVLNFVPQY